MKIFNVLGGLLLLLVSAHGDEEDLFVACSEFWLQVKIRRAPFVDELQPQPYELYLGTGCPVSRILPSYFEFIYTLTSCGIRKYERLWGILIESSVSYEPVFLNVRGHVPISCSIQRKLSFTFTSKEVESNGSASGETSRGPVEKKNSTCQVENFGTHPGPSFVNSVSLGGVVTFPWS